MLWTLLANIARLIIAAGGGWLALRWTGNLTEVFVALSVALATFGLINAAAVASGVWFSRKAGAVMTEQYFEDFAVGQTFATGRHRVDKDQIVTFAKQFDPQYYHLDEEAAKKSPFKGLAASGWHTAAMTMRLMARRRVQTGRRHHRCRLRSTESWSRPVRPGDELHVKSEVLEVRPSKSRNDRGMIRVQNTTLNQNDEVVQEFTGNLLVPRRSPAG